MQGTIHTRAMLARVSLSVWTARKYDKKVSDDVNKQHSAAKDAGRFNKHLLGGQASAGKHQLVLAAASAVRAEHYKQTLPGTDEGWRILTTANWSHYTSVIRKASVDFDNAVREFIDEYPALRDGAKVLLNGLYREEDYPTPLEIKERFGCRIEYQPIPAKGDLRVSLTEDEVAQIESDVEERVRQSTAIAMADAWSRLSTVVSNVRDRLADPDAIFRDSLIGNVEECVDVLRRLNLTGDANLETMRQRVQSEIASLAPQNLRHDPIARADAAQRANEILAAMKGVYGG